MVYKFEWKPFWLAIQLFPQNDMPGWQVRVKDDVQYCRVPKNGLPKNGQAGISFKN